MAPLCHLLLSMDPALCRREGIAAACVMGLLFLVYLVIRGAEGISRELQGEDEKEAPR